jgi:putative membrane protein
MPLRKVIHMSEADHQLVTQAVAETEKHTIGEIVTIVTDRSDSYHDVALLWANAIAFLAVAVVAFIPDFFLTIVDQLLGGWGHEFTSGEYVAMLFIFMALMWTGVYLLLKWTPLRMFLTPRPIKIRRAQERAMQLFKVGAESRTIAHTGILIFLSMREHRAEIIADTAIAAKVTPEIWGDAMLALIDKVRAGAPGEGMAAAVHQVGAVLIEHFPKSGDNPNELPDRLIEI